MKVDILELRTPNDQETIQNWIDANPPVAINFVVVNDNYIYIFYTEL